MRHIFSLLFCCFILSVPLLGQKTQVFETDLDNYRRGLELYDKEKYSAAQHVFEQLIEDIDDPTNEARVNAEYYGALCAINLFNRDADFMLREFIRKHPESPLVRKAEFQLGIYHHRKRQWKECIYWLNKVNVYNLAPSEKHDYYFKIGYAYFEEDSFQQASQKFFQIKDVENPYAAPAQYYFSHIAYKDGKNQTALEGFRKLEEHPQFGPVVPFYIAQILYKQEKFDELLEYAPPLLENKNTKRVEEISRLIGEAHFNNKDYEKAIPYYDEFIKRSRKVTAEDRYNLAYCYYKSGQYENAIGMFSRLGAYENELGQTSLYQLADCYLKTDDKPAARNAFLEVYKMGYDEQLTEDALFSYSKLSYELKFDPYNKAIKGFKRYIEEYPNSTRLDEAYNYLTNLYLTTKNYDEALNSIEKIENLDLQLKEAYQKIAFNKAIKEFQNRGYESAIAYFERSQTYPVNKPMNTLSHYWIAEARYQQENFSGCIKEYKTYIYEPAAILQEQFSMAHYSLGYAYFKLKNYDDAATWFRKYVDDDSVKDSMRVGDAYLRIGDSYFIQKEYHQALDFYQDAIDVNRLDVDYAMYQKAVTQGILKQSGEKISTLQNLVAGYTGSKYLDAAKYQLGRSFIVKDSTRQAVQYLEAVVNDHPNSRYVKKSLVSLGLIYYNARENEKALAVFKRIINDYPNYEDAREALIGIRNIYVEAGNVDEYANYVNGLDFVNVSQSALDSTTYEAAELKYLNGDCAQAKEAFSSYLERFTPANFALNAHFYRGECYYRNQEYEKALEDYNYVTGQAVNKFTESALVKASEINYKEDRFNEALSNYTALEKIASFPANRKSALIGQMRCFYHLNSYTSAAEYAQKVLAEDKIQEDVKTEAHFIRGVSFEEKGEFDKAIQEYSYVSDTTTAEISAEAKYHVADIYFKQDSFKLAKKHVNGIVTQVPAYDYWIAKGLILLADIFLANGDTFQAKATLQSIVDNYDGDPMILQIAETNLGKIEEMEKEEEQPEEEQIEIDIGNLDEDMQGLFGEEEEVEEEIPGNNDNK